MSPVCMYVCHSTTSDGVPMVSLPERERVGDYPLTSPVMFFTCSGRTHLSSPLIVGVASFVDCHQQ